MSLTKCPFCGEESLGDVKTSTGTSYILTEVTEPTKTFHADAGLPVKVVGCLNCKRIQLFCPSLKK